MKAIPLGNAQLEPDFGKKTGNCDYPWPGLIPLDLRPYGEPKT